MITYWLYLTIFLAGLILIVYLIKRNPDLVFWFLINIYFDPGGYVTYYFGNKLILNLYLADIAVILILFCLFIISANYWIIFKDQFLVEFLKGFSIFVAYYYIVYGYIVPYMNDDLDYLLFLQKSRHFLYYIVILLSVYIFTMRGLRYFYLTTFFLGTVILGIFIFAIVTGADIIPIWVFERYSDSEMMRISMYSWGLFYILFPLSLILYLFSRRIKLNIKYKKIAYAAGLLMVVALLITLSRRNFISIPGTILIIILINSYIFRKSEAFALTKILVPFSVVLLIIYLTLPKYVYYIADITQDTFHLITQGSDTRGEKEYRVSGTGDLEVTKKYIRENLILGTGYNYLYWGESDRATSSRGTVYALAMDAAQEVPVYYIFFGFGLVGFLIMVFLYTFLIRLFLKLFKLMRNNIELLTAYPYEILFVIFTLYMIADKFTFSIYSLGTDFTTAYNGIFIGIGFALLKKIRTITSGSAMNSKNKLIPDRNLVQEASIP